MKDILKSLVTVVFFAMFPLTSHGFSYSWTGVVGTATGSGLVGLWDGVQPQNNELIFSWVVQENASHDQWRYVYVTYPASGTELPGEVFVRTSQQLMPSNILPGSTSGWEFKWIYPSTHPGLSEPVYGLSIKWKQWLELYSDMPPVWGGFYAGNSSGDYVFTEHFHDESIPFSFSQFASGPLHGRFPVPSPQYDLPASVSEPSGVLLIILGSLLLFFVHRKN